jgi:molecular chaperone DnaJ
MAEPRDYYEVLEVPRDADDATIKKAYRKLAMQYHPDRNPGDASAEAKFKEASEAYSVLSDEQKRATFDRFGHAGLRGQGPGGGPGFQSADEIFSQFGDLFGDMFGFGGGRGRGRGGPRGGSDLRMRVQLDFLAAVHGTTKEIEVPREQSCEPCTGSGAEPGSAPVTCTTCGGAGQVLQQVAFMRVQTTCPRCRGRGKTIKDPCRKCSGAGRVRVPEKVSVSFPPGMDAGKQLRVSGKGDAGDPGGPSGDLYIEVEVGEHEVFRRDGDDIILTRSMSFPQACLGAEIKVPTVDGEEALTIPPGTPSGKVITLRGKGAPRLGGKRGRGDQHVQLIVEVPEKLSGEEEGLIRKLAELQKHPVHEKGLLDGLRDLFKG